MVTFAIGIAASAAIFSLVQVVLLKPLPFPESDGLVAVWQTAPVLNVGNLNASPATYYTYREESHTFEDIGLWQRKAASITGIAEPEQIRVLRVTDGVLPLLRLRPLLGRWFTRQDDEPRAPATAILSYGYWQRRLGGDRSAVGRTIKVDGVSHEMIGIMPERFR